MLKQNFKKIAYIVDNKSKKKFGLYYFFHYLEPY